MIKPGTVVRYSDAHVFGVSGVDPDARFVVLPRHEGTKGRKGKPVCYRCAAGAVPVEYLGGTMVVRRPEEVKHVHPDNLTEIAP